MHLKRELKGFKFAGASSVATLSDASKERIERIFYVSHSTTLDSADASKERIERPEPEYARPERG